MLGNDPYNFKTIEKITAAFGWLFQDITIQRRDPGTQALKSIKVPVELATKEKWAQRYMSDPNAGDEANQKHVQIVLPRMAYEMTNFRYDGRRKLSPIMYRVVAGQNNTVLKRQLNPVPMIFQFSLYLATRTLEDAYAIMEQFLPFFQPDFTINILDIPEIGLKRDIIFSLVSNNHQDNYEGNFQDKRTIEWTFDFEARGHIYPPIKEKKIITEADIRVHELGFQDQVGTVHVEIDPSTAMPNQPFEVVDS